MAQLILENLTAANLKTRRQKKSKGGIASLATSQTSKLYTVVANKNLIAGDRPTNSQETAEATLESIGCTVKSSSLYPKEFSVKRTQNQASLDNKNIVDPNVSTLANAKSSPNTKFTNDTDPFYEMDDTRAVYQQIEQNRTRVTEMVDTSQLCADIYIINATAGSSKKIKQLR